MPSIKSIQATTNDVSLFLLQTIQQIESGEFDPKNVMFAMKDSDGQWITGFSNMDFATRQEGIAHQQVDVIDSMIRENKERYIIGGPEDNNV